MNRQHPLDDAFRDKLQDLTTETPMHLWEQIDQKRNWKHRFLNQIRHYRPFATVLASMAAAGVALLLWNNQQPTLTAFPVLATPHQPQVALRAAASPSVTKTIEQHKETESTAFANTSRPAARSPQSTLNISDEPSVIAVPKATVAQSAAITTQQSTQPLASAVLDYSKTEANPLATAEQTTLAVSASVLPKPAHEAALPGIAAVYEREQKAVLPALFNPEPKCAQFGNGNWGIYVDLMVSPDLAFSDLEARNANFEDYAKSRRETESFVFAYSGGVRLSLEAANGLAFRTGINYSQVNEKFTYFNGTERREITEPVRDNQGNIIGYDTIVTVGERYKVSRNTYRMLDIPFIVGYEMDMGKFGLSVNGGAYLNLLFRQSGDFLSPETLTPTPLNPEDPNTVSVFKRQAGVGYYGSVALTYATKSGLELLIEPHFKMFPNSVTQDQFAVQQRHMNAGIFMGIRKHL
ncbi:MAG: hypothetical protein ACE362_27555 [Phaeodactylibacter xiamenensis]|uniref:Outer membrane protein beta-barrel domain-containing protein n=1 Tax=Phaeodactylibacter xiamenensis TaxID=1524460 RepID=A0A098S9S5_9BACT|nr:hypothetical protein [Phaeodactylibacter xiamenensis]KGE87822.1 hypothetical protein IX84_11845 [Phaeodactylibacter xiamenensis]MCR9053706.1 hypothetical protein [bacterium]